MTDGITVLLTFVLWLVVPQALIKCGVLDRPANVLLSTMIFISAFLLAFLSMALSMLPKDLLPKLMLTTSVIIKAMFSKPNEIYKPNIRPLKYNIFQTEKVPKKFFKNK